MELPAVGKPCSSSNCKQLDFLPLQCKCGKLFCSNHFNSHIQNCETSKYLLEDQLTKIQNIFVCSHIDCKERSVIPLICYKCKKHFCVKHRHLVNCEDTDPQLLAAEQEKYAAPVRQFNEAKAAIDKQVEYNLKEAKTKPKCKDMAMKVQLMKIKNKATGNKSIAITDRVYFSIAHPKKDFDTTTPVFVSTQWTIGRVTDAVAQELKLQNNNNKLNEKKLRLFKMENNSIISKNMSVTLSKLLEDNIITNGETLIIEYVDDNTFRLD